MSKWDCFLVELTATIRSIVDEGYNDEVSVHLKKLQREQKFCDYF